MLTAKTESMINMDREQQQQPNQQTTPPPLLTAKQEDSPRKPPLPVIHGGSGGSGDRLKRDEWSEGAVSTLLEAYEAKWILRNRAKLKGQDWEDVARYVSARASSSKSPKTQTQCKNKIESMKKRYRSESSIVDPASPSASTWPLYPRLDLLLRGSSLSPQPVMPQLPLPPPLPPMHPVNAPMSLIEPPLYQQPLPQFLTVTPISVAAAQNYQSNGVEDIAAKENVVATKVSEDHISSDKAPMETDSSTPALYSDDNDDKEKSKSKKTKPTIKDKKRKKSRSSREDWDIAESIRWLADVVIRAEQARMKTMRELEKMRAEAEAKRAEIDLKRTEIIANTQLEIAKLFAGVTNGKGLDSSLRIGRN